MVRLVADLGAALRRPTTHNTTGDAMPQEALQADAAMEAEWAQLEGMAESRGEVAVA